MMGCRQCRCPIAMPMLFARTMLSTRVDSHFFFRMRLSTGVDDAASIPKYPLKGFDGLPAAKKQAS